MTYTLIFMILASPQVLTGNLLFESLRPVKWVPISIRVDFGPGGGAGIEKELIVPEGESPKEALGRICRVEGGAACCHPAEVKGINGVMINPMKNRWWRLKINGTAEDASPHKSRLQAGDRMEWVYFEDKQ